jgi:hypothetical protein
MVNPSRPIILSAGNLHPLQALLEAVREKESWHRLSSIACAANKQSCFPFSAEGVVAQWQEHPTMGSIPSWIPDLSVDFLLSLKLMCGSYLCTQNS